jgi:sec-independent protein translocase protein TatA
MSLLALGVVAAGILGGIGMPELLIILVVILIIFGPKNLPKLGSALGRTVKGVREGLEGVKGELEDAEIEEIEEDTPKAKKKSSK